MGRGGMNASRSTYMSRVRGGSENQTRGYKIVLSKNLVLDC